MKTKFTLLIIAGLFFATATQAQDRNYDYDHHSDGYKNDSRHGRNEDFDYRTRMDNLRQKLEHEMDELDRARECGDWEKAHHEKREIAEIRDEMRHINYHKWADQQNDFNRHHEYNNRN